MKYITAILWGLAVGVVITLLALCRPQPRVVRLPGWMWMNPN